MKLPRVRGWWYRNKDEIKIGLMLGVMLSLLWVGVRQTNLGKQVLYVSESIKNQNTADNKAREQVRVENATRQQQILSYIQCNTSLIIDAFNASNRGNTLQLQSLDTCSYILLPSQRSQSQTNTTSTNSTQPSSAGTSMERGSSGASPPSPSPTPPPAPPSPPPNPITQTTGFVKDLVSGVLKLIP